MSAMRRDHARAYDAIAIKEVLARVAGSRVTDATRAREHLIEFAATILDHVERERAEGAPAGDAGEKAAAHERLRDLLTDLVLADLRALPRREQPARRPTLPPELLARWLASTFVLVLDWWQGSATPLPARDADERFRSLVVPVLDAELD